MFTDDEFSEIFDQLDQVADDILRQQANQHDELPTLIARAHSSKFGKAPTKPSAVPTKPTSRAEKAPTEKWVVAPKPDERSERNSEGAFAISVENPRAIISSNQQPSVSTAWQWDPSRNEYFIWAPVQGCWVYQNGDFVYPDDNFASQDRCVIDDCFLLKLSFRHFQYCAD
jgi:hypothetical protein